MIIKHGDLFTTEATKIGHGVNTKGVMGAGIAKAFKEKYPNNYKAYANECKLGNLKPGGLMVWLEDGKSIYNLASQDNPGADASYAWLFESTNRAARRLLNMKEKTLAIPQIGCGIGGLDWDEAEKVLRTVELINPGFEFEVWIYA